MAIIKKEIDYAKELGDVGLCLLAIVKDVKAGKPLLEIAAGEFQKLVDAVNGIDQVAVELAANKAACYATVGSQLGELVDALLAPKALPPSGAV